MLTAQWDERLCCYPGYADQKQIIEDTMLLALRYPEVYDKIAQGTRHTYASNKPRAVLFEGPPGQPKDKAALAHVTGYVEQDDVHTLAFTVHEFFRFRTHTGPSRDAI